MEQNPEVDYAELYRRMVRATEEAIDTLLEAQQACEELYIKAGEKGAVITLKERKAGVRTRSWTEYDRKGMADVFRRTVQQST